VRGPGVGNWLFLIGPNKSEEWITVFGKNRRKSKKKKSGGSDRLELDRNMMSGTWHDANVGPVASAPGSFKIRAYVAIERNSSADTHDAEQNRLAGKEDLRLSKSAAVMICCEKDGLSYSKIVGQARRNISLTEFGITNTKIKKAEEFY